MRCRWAGFRGRLGFSQADAPSLRWAAVGAVPLLTLLAAAVGGALAAVVVGQARRVVAGLVALAVTGVWLGGGLLPDPPSSEASATVAVVQGNVPRGRDLAEQVRVRQVTQNHADATIELAEDVRAGRVPAPDLVVWPENSTDTDPRRDAEMGAVIEQAVRAIGRPVLVGGFRVDDAGRTFNVGQVWTPLDGPVGEYAKRRLVPFGEYVPARAVLGWVGQLQLVPRDMTPGTGDGVLTAAGIRFGDVICYEVAYDDLVRSSVAAGAQLLVVQTNNATYMRDGQTGETLQQLAMARVRAVEHGRAVLVASTTGGQRGHPAGRLAGRAHAAVATAGPCRARRAVHNARPVGVTVDRTPRRPGRRRRPGRDAARLPMAPGRCSGAGQLVWWEPTQCLGDSRC